MMVHIHKFQVKLLTIGQVSMVVVRERELGTLEQLLITPVRPLELIISKVMPNIIITIADTVLIVLIGVVWFGVPFQGSVWLFAWLSLLFIVSGLGLGLLNRELEQSFSRQHLAISLQLCSAWRNPSVQEPLACS